MPRKPKMTPVLPSSPVPMQAIPLELGEKDLEAIATGKIKLTVQQIDAMLRLVHAQIAQQGDDEAAFASFYYVIMGKELPKHAENEWVKALYEGRREKKGSVIEAFRGSTKTTTLTMAFAAWRIGKEPERANLLIQVGDDIAGDNTKQVADIIANNPGWKMVFPHVVPDMERGWGAAGYEVKRMDMEYAAWRERCAKRKDPTLVGLGYKSRAIIGKHPDGVLIVDDICDENNTRSERELANLREILTGTIFPTMTPDTWPVFVGTPWVENDALRYVVSTGLFRHVQTPVYREVDGEKVYTWPEVFGEEAVANAKVMAGQLQFARMFLLDLSAAANRVFKYQLYPASEIRPNWPMVGGVDYAGSMDEFKNKAGDNDYFALAYVAKLPGGGAVVVDGVLDRCTQGQAEGYVNRAQAIWPLWQTAVVEGDGKGEEFIQTIRRNPNLRLQPMKTHGRGKKERLERQLGPWLENGTIRVSDAETPFLNELRRELDNYPYHTHDDALDAVYWAMIGMPDVTQMPKWTGEIPIPEAFAKPKANPFTSLGRR